MERQISYYLEEERHKNVIIQTKTSVAKPVISYSSNQAEAFNSTILQPQYLSLPALVSPGRINITGDKPPGQAVAIPTYGEWQSLHHHP